MTKLLVILGSVLLAAGGGAYGVYVSTCDSADGCHSCCQNPAPVEPVSGGCCDASRAALLSGPSCCDSGEATKPADVSLEAVLGAAAVVARD